MKKLSAFMALLALLASSFAFANTATVTSAAGTVQVVTGTTPARTLRVGDIVRQGDTITTGARSSAVLKFEDGQVTALTANSRLAITTYRYNPQTQAGNVLLSLIDGGMRAITGLIGRRTPDNVAYRAATATIGIRGTDITVATNQGRVMVTVNAGQITFTFQGRTLTLSTGQAAVTQGNIVSQVTAAAAEQEIQGTALAAIIEAAKSDDVTAAIEQAGAGQPGQGGQPSGEQGKGEGEGQGQQQGPPGGQPTQGPPSGPSGGGGASGG